MDESIKKINDQIAKEKSEIMTINERVQKAQEEIRKLIKISNMREGRISILSEQLKTAQEGLKKKEKKKWL